VSDVPRTLPRVEKDSGNSFGGTVAGGNTSFSHLDGRSLSALEGKAAPALSLRVLALLVVLYAGLGKTFSYAGVGSLYIGEVALLLTTALVFLRCRFTVSGMRGFPLLIASTLGVFQIVTQLTNGAPPREALRNFAVIYYVWFAVLAYAAMQGQAESASPSLRQMRRLGTAVLMILTAATVIHFTLGASLPLLPGAGVPILSYKPTDAGLVLLVLLALWLRQALPTWAIALIVPQLVVAVAVSRSTLLCAIVVLVLVGRRSPRILKFVGASVLAVLLLTIANPTFVVNSREVSIRQIQVNALSVVTSNNAQSSDQSLSDNKGFRLRWWRGIVDDASSLDAVFSGDGWSTNLADKYGFQTSYGSQSELRNPHNVFIGLVGRAGWLVAGSYLFFMLTFVWRGLRCLRLSLSTDELVAIEVALVVATGGIINGATDVYMESPQNAIPYWIIIGVGSFHLTQLQRRQAVCARTVAR